MAVRIVSLSWPAREITGGIKMASRHVEALRAAGLDAVFSAFPFAAALLAYWRTPPR